MILDTNEISHRCFNLHQLLDDFFSGRVLVGINYKFLRLIELVHGLTNQIMQCIM